MSGKAFLDTNIFVYMQSAQDQAKRLRCLNVIDRYDCVVSTQVANELCNVFLRKFSMPVGNIKNILSAVNKTCHISVVTMETIEKALSLKEKYNYSYYDSLIIASALELECRYLFSEDMNDGQIIENSLKIINIFMRDNW